MINKELNQEILEQLQNAIETETKAIFNQISELIDHKYTQKKVNGVEIDFELLDQRIADKFTNYQQVLIKVCEHSQLKKYFRSYLKECFKHFKIICEQEYQEWQKKNPDHAKIYDIKLPDWKIATLPRRDNTLTEDKLCNGAILADFKEKFYEKWSYSLNKKTQNISLQSTVEAQQNLVNILFECLCISLIFDQGCIHPERLIAIHDAIFEMNLDSGLLPIYSGSKNHAYVFSYTLSSQKYGNFYRYDSQGDVELWQTQQIYFNAISMLCYLRIREHLHGNQGYALQFTSPLSIWQQTHDDQDQKVKREDLLYKRLKAHFKDVVPDHQFIKEFGRRRFSAFKHIDYVLWQEIPNLDLLSTSVLNNKIITTPLIYEQHIAIYHQLDTWKTIQERIENTHHTVELSVSTSGQNVKVYNDKRMGKRNDIKSLLLSFSEDGKELTLAKFNEALNTSINKSEGDIRSYEAGEGEYIDYVVAIAHLRICQWLKYELGYNSGSGKASLQVASIKRYYHSFVSDFLIYILEYQINLNNAIEEQFEEMYEYLILEKSMKDQEKQETIAEKNDNKKHDTSGYSFARLKTFHQYLVNKHDAPVVAYLYEHQRDSGKFLKTRTISPQMFELMMKIVKNYPHILGISGNDIVALQWVYRLAFRLGLRIDEVTGIRLNDFDSAQLRSHLKNNRLYYEAKSDPKDTTSNESSNSDIENLVLKIHSNSHRNVKNENANRQFDLSYFLNPNEFKEFCDFYKKYLAASLSEAELQVQNTLLFTFENQQLSKITRSLFNLVLGTSDHSYTFHAFRHSAASHLAILLKGSHQLICSFTDYDSRFVGRLKKHILQNIDHASLHSADVWQRLAHLMGHEDFNVTASSYIHHLNILIADMFYTAKREYQPELIGALLKNSKIINAQFKSLKISEDESAFNILQKSKFFLKVFEKHNDPKQFLKKDEIEKKQMSFLYPKRFLESYQEWKANDRIINPEDQLVNLIKSISRQFYIYKDKEIARSEERDLQEMDLNWERMINWSYLYGICHPFIIDKEITQKEIKNFYYILENKISLKNDRSVLVFEAVCQKDLKLYDSFVELITKIYSDVESYLDIEKSSSSDFDKKIGSEVKIKYYKISNKKADSKHHLIQKIVLQSIFFKMKCLGVPSLGQKKMV